MIKTPDSAKIDEPPLVWGGDGGLGGSTPRSKTCIQRKCQLGCDGDHIEESWLKIDGFEEKEVTEILEWGRRHIPWGRRHTPGGRLQARPRPKGLEVDGDKSLLDALAMEETIEKDAAALPTTITHGATEHWLSSQHMMQVEVSPMPGGGGAGAAGACFADGGLPQPMVPFTTPGPCECVDRPAFDRCHWCTQARGHHRRKQAAHSAASRERQRQGRSISGSRAAEPGKKKRRMSPEALHPYEKGCLWRRTKASKGTKTARKSKAKMKGLGPKRP